MATLESFKTTLHALVRYLVKPLPDEMVVWADEAQPFVDPSFGGAKVTLDLLANRSIGTDEQRTGRTDVLSAGVVGPYVLVEDVSDTLQLALFDAEGVEVDTLSLVFGADSYTAAELVALLTGEIDDVTFTDVDGVLTLTLLDATYSLLVWGNANTVLMLPHGNTTILQAGQRIATITIGAQCLTHHGDQWAMRWVNQVRDRMHWQQVQAAMKAACIAFIDATEARKVGPFVVDERTYTKAQIDIRFAYAHEERDTGYDGGVIETVELTSPFGTPDNTYNINPLVLP